MQLKLDPIKSILPPDAIEHFEKKYNAKYLLDTCVKDLSGQWVNAPFAIFYQETPPQPDYSHYFAVRVAPGSGQCYISSGQSAADEPITAIVAATGLVYYSRFRHDYRGVPSGDAIDGGRDYTKVVFSAAPPKMATITLVDGEIVISPAASQ